MTRSGSHLNPKHGEVWVRTDAVRIASATWTRLSSRGVVILDFIVLTAEDGTPHPWLHLDVL
jgi:hypothetical protein